MSLVHGPSFGGSRGCLTGIQACDPEQVVGGGHRLGEFESTVARPLEPAHVFIQPKFSPIRLRNRWLIALARVASGSSVDGAVAMPAGVLRHVWVTRRARMSFTQSLVS